MIKKLILSTGVAITAFVLGSAGAFAYTGSAGASITTSTTTVAPGGQVTVTATFTTPGGPGNNVTFSFSGGGAGCTETFNPTSGTTDSSGSISTVVTIGASCGGVLAETATNNTTGQTVTTSITTTGGGLPNASAEKPAGQNLPIGPIAILVASLALIALAGGTLLRRRS